MICLVDGVEKFLDVTMEGMDLRTLASFVCKYAFHTCTIKDDLKMRLQSAQKEAGELEKDNLWDCVADFLTNSDLAFAVWQYSTVQVTGRRRRSVKIQVCGTHATQDGRQTSLHRGT
jgi:hypothetical protein